MTPSSYIDYFARIRADAQRCCRAVSEMQNMVDYINYQAEAGDDEAIAIMEKINGSV